MNKIVPVTLCALITGCTTPVQQSRHLDQQLPAGLPVTSEECIVQEDGYIHIAPNDEIYELEDINFEDREVVLKNTDTGIRYTISQGKEIRDSQTYLKIITPECVTMRSHSQTTVYGEDLGDLVVKAREKENALFVQLHEPVAFTYGNIMHQLKIVGGNSEGSIILEINGARYKLERGDDFEKDGVEYEVKEIYITNVPELDIAANIYVK